MKLFSGMENPKIKVRGRVQYWRVPIGRDNILEADIEVGAPEQGPY